MDCFGTYLRLFPDAATRPYCREALFLFFSGKLSLPLCAWLIAQHQEDQPEAVSEAKTSFHRAKASPITFSKSTCQRPLFLTQLARPTPAQAMRVSPAAALGVRPRSLRTQPHSQRATPHALFRPAMRSRLPAVYKRHWSPTKYSQG